MEDVPDRANARGPERSQCYRGEAVVGLRGNRLDARPLVLEERQERRLAVLVDGRLVVVAKPGGRVRFEVVEVRPGAVEVVVVECVLEVGRRGEQTLTAARCVSPEPVCGDSPDDPP
jgi:hypothetical protein